MFTFKKQTQLSSWSCGKRRGEFEHGYAIFKNEKEIGREDIFIFDFKQGKRKAKWLAFKERHNLKVPPYKDEIVVDSTIPHTDARQHEN